MDFRVGAIGRIEPKMGGSHVIYAERMYVYTAELTLHVYCGPFQCSNTIRSLSRSEILAICWHSACYTGTYIVYKIYVTCFVHSCADISSTKLDNQIFVLGISLIFHENVKQ